MTLNKDTIIKALISGIYVSITFDENGNIVDCKELFTNYFYLDDMLLTYVQMLANDSKSTIKGTFKACLTIKRKNLSAAFNIYKDRNIFIEEPDFKKLIIDCLKAEEYMDYVSLIICGNIDDDEEYDELYNCVLCKHFSQFDTSPKMKLRFDVSPKDFKAIVTNWLNVYIFDRVLINHSYEYQLYECSKKLIIDEKDIRWKEEGTRFVPYLSDITCLTQLPISDIFITSDDRLSNNSYYTLNGYLIVNNIFKLLYDSFMKERGELRAY